MKGFSFFSKIAKSLDRTVQAIILIKLKYTETLQLILYVYVDPNFTPVKVKMMKNSNDYLTFVLTNILRRKGEKKGRERMK